MKPESMPRLLRKVPTDAEKKLRSRLRQHQLGCKFRRQHPVGGYIADFACIEQRLIVEADGGQHADNPNDAIRTRRLEALGWRVLRFWNNDIMANADGVVETILQALQSSPAETPSPGLLVQTTLSREGR